MTIFTKALLAAGAAILGSAVGMKILVLPALEQGVSEQRMMAIALQVGTVGGIASGSAIIAAGLLSRPKKPILPGEAILLQLQRTDISPSQAARLSEAYAALEGNKLP